MDSDNIRILAWDPSLRNLGLSVGDMDTKNRQVTIVQATTFYIDKLTESHGLFPTWGEDVNVVRMAMLEYIIPRALSNYKPDLVVIERPIFNKLNPKTLMTQMLAIATLERIALEHRSTFRDGMTEYMPNQIKIGVGVPETREAFRDKMQITYGLQRCMERKELLFADTCYEPHNVDEHANDATAMVYTKFKELLTCL